MSLITASGSGDSGLPEWMKLPACLTSRAGYNEEQKGASDQQPFRTFASFAVMQPGLSKRSLYARKT